MFGYCAKLSMCNILSTTNIVDLLNFGPSLMHVVAWMDTLSNFTFDMSRNKTAIQPVKDPASAVFDRDTRLLGSFCRSRSNKLLWLTID
jgi:hypothetical protein